MTTRQRSEEGPSGHLREPGLARHGSGAKLGGRPLGYLARRIEALLKGWRDKRAADAEALRNFETFLRAKRESCAHAPAPIISAVLRSVRAFADDPAAVNPGTSIDILHAEILHDYTWLLEDLGRELDFEIDDRVIWSDEIRNLEDLAWMIAYLRTAEPGVSQGALTRDRQTQ